MEFYQNQILGGTRLDSQGERLTKAQLERFCLAFAGKKMPLHQLHDMARELAGFAENLRVEPDRQLTGEWSLVGDVLVTNGTLDDVLMGFSISFTEPLRDVEDPDVLLYIPYPFYNDKDLLDTLSVDGRLKIGRWVKKAADSATIAMFGAAVSFILRPAWDQLYKEKISPLVTKFLSSHGTALRNRGITLEHIQLITFNGCDIELRFIPSEDRGNACFSQRLLINGIRLTEEHLARHPNGVQRVVRVILCYDPVGREYYIERIECALV